MDDNDADCGEGFVFINDMGESNDEVDDVSAIGVAVDDSDGNVVVGIDVVVAPGVNNIDEMVIVLPVVDDNEADCGKGFVFINDMGKGNDEVGDVSAIGVTVDDSDRSVVVGIDVVVVAPVVNNIDEMVIVLPVSLKLDVEASV